jgi:lipoprotein-anchoring transpeptidase ErfK/SrfK
MNRSKRSWLYRSGAIAATTMLTFSAVTVLPTPGFNPGGMQATEASQPGKIALAVKDLKQSNQRWIEVDLSRQRLIAWEGKKPVHAVIVSTGKSSTPTVTGVFEVQTKYASARMQGDDYDIPDVPYTMYFFEGYAIHGAYWHHNFGTPVSHGCVNVAVDHAEWFFNWAEVGTPVVVHD